MTAAVPFDELGQSDLVIDRVYKGGTAKNAADDPIGVIAPVGNQGGFRFRGSIKDQTVQLVVLYTTGRDLDWPDVLDPETGDFTYYGDNKKPGSELHETPRRGNALLRDMFTWSRGNPDDRLRVPPILLFEKQGVGRDVVFRGLAAPGSPRLTAEEELVAVWRTTQQHRFQNYRAHFTVLKTDTVPRAWLNDILAGDPLSEHCPSVWRRWVQGRIYDPLLAPRTTDVRTRADQYPRTMDVLNCVYEHFAPDPIAFEHFAVDMWMHLDHHVGPVDITRRSRDGGRDAVGDYLVGPLSDPIKISFALEAKCYRPGGSGIGVKMVSRLISRLKYRDFGVFVTTAHIGDQPYREVREDNHPVVFITGGDIVDILRDMGHRSVADVQTYLDAQFPTSPEEAESAPTASLHADVVAARQAAEAEVALPDRAQAR